MKKEAVFVFLLTLSITAIFFYPIFRGHIPFPGDNLVGGFEPYKSDSRLGYAPGGVPHKAQGADVIRQLYPWKYFSIEQLKSFSIPFWNPYNFSGNPHFANFQSSTFYPWNFLFFAFSFEDAWTIYILLQPILAIIFTYLFLRELRLKKIASILGGICFAFSGFMISWLEWGSLGHALLYLPLILLLIITYLRHSDIYKLLLLLLALSSSILAGYVQVFMYVYIFSLSFLLYLFVIDKDKRKNWKSYLELITVFIFSVLVVSFQLLPTLELLELSLRAPYTFDELPERLIPIQNLITLVAPDFFGNPATRNYFLSGTYIERSSYIGILPLLFSFFVIYSRQKHVKFFLFASLFIYVSTLDILPVKFLHSLSIPFLSTGVPSRSLSIFGFCLSILAAIGFEAFLQEKEKKKFIKPTFVLFIIILFAWVFTLIIDNPNSLISRRNLILPSAIFLSGIALIFQKKLSIKLASILLFLLILFDLFYLFHKMTPFSPKEFFYPKSLVTQKLSEIQGMDRFWGYGSAYIEANFQVYEKNFSPDGYDPLYLKRYGELIYSSKYGKIQPDIPRAVANIAGGYGKSDLRSNRYRQRILNLLGVKYILNKVNVEDAARADYETFPQEIYKMIWYKDTWQIYENKQALPRIFLTKDYVVENDKEDIILLIHDDAFPLDKKLIFEEELQEDLDLKEDRHAFVKVLSHKPNKIIIRTNSVSDSLLFLSDNFYPGWRVKVDDNEKKIYRANYSFRAVVVPRGDHKVTFWYYPKSFDIGVKVSLLALSLIMLYLMLRSLRYFNVQR